MKRSLLIRLRGIKGLDVPESELEFRVIAIDEKDFKLESNLDRFGLSEEESHKMMESACLGVGSLSSRIEEMKVHNALSGCVDHELALFGEKFDLLADVLRSGSRKATMDVPLQQREDDFGRVLRLCKLPTFDLHPPDKSFDMDRFLEVRSSREAAEFRAWLHTAHTSSDAEIRDQLHTFRAKLAGFLETKVGHVARFVVSSIAGMVADAYAPSSGTAVGALDAFLIDRLLRAKGPALFLSQTYRTMFEQQKDEEAKSADKGC